MHIQDGHDLGWRMVDMLGSSLWAVDSRDCLMVRDNATQDNIDGEMLSHDYLSFYSASFRWKSCPHFPWMSELQAVRPSRQAQQLHCAKRGLGHLWEVKLHGAETNFFIQYFYFFMQGRSLICLDGDCFSNDPNNPKGLKLKQWQTGRGIFQFQFHFSLPVLTRKS